MSENQEESDMMVQKRTAGDLNIVSVIFSALKKASVIGAVYFAGYMQWSVAWFIGPLVLSVIRDQWKKSSERKRTTSKAAALASEKDVVLARLNDLPAWVFFPDVERAEWLNKIMKQVWPNVNQYVKQIVRDSIQPVLKESLEKYKLSGFKFERIILGTVPFRIGGVKVYDKNTDRNEIIMDLDIFYAGDCDITFYLKGMKGGIRDFQLHGMLRVVMKPLITSIPLVGGLQVFFLNNPDIDFDLVGIADFLDMPGLSDILRRIVVETVANMMVLPNKFPIKLSDEIEAAELKAPEPEGVLRVHIVEAKHLMKKDISMLGKGKSDPYCVVTVGAQEFRTKVIDNNVDPKWDYWCEFNILESNGQQLYVHVWDKDDPGDDESLGRATIEVENLVKNGYEDTWITLEQAKHGMVHLRFYWLTLSAKYEDLQAILYETRNLQSSALSTALLTVFIDSAKNLPQARTSTKPDPYAVLRVGSQTQKTNVLMRTIHPVWEQGFTFFVTNPENDSLNLSIMDQKTNSEIGQLVYKIKSICQKAKMEVSKEPFTLLKSGPDSKVVWSMHLRILKKTSEESDHPELLRSCSKISTASISSTDFTLPRKPSQESLQPTVREKRSSLPDIESQPLIKENRQDVSAGVISGEVSDTSSEDVLLRRNPSITSSAGEAGLGRILLTLYYSIQRQRLIVTVHKIANVPLKDPSNIPDPYVKLYLLPERSKDSKKKTQIIKDNCNPIFEETFEYVINQAEVCNKKLEVTACTQKQLFGGTNFLGQVVLELGAIDISQPFNAWFDLMPE